MSPQLTDYIAYHLPPVSYHKLRNTIKLSQCGKKSAASARVCWLYEIGHLSFVLVTKKANRIRLTFFDMDPQKFCLFSSNS
jgi:hypothetical protein